MSACLRFILLMWLSFGLVGAEESREQKIWDVVGPSYLRLISEKEEVKRSREEANVLAALMTTLTSGVELRFDDVISYAGNPISTYSQKDGSNKIYLYEASYSKIDRTYMLSVNSSGEVTSLTFNISGANNFSSAIPYVGDMPRPPTPYLNRKNDTLTP